MDNSEYLKSLIDRFNINQDDENFTKTEKTLLFKILAVQKEIDVLLNKKTELEKQINDAKKAISALETNINKEKIKSDTYTEILVALR